MDSKNNLEKTINVAGGAALGKGVETAVTAMTGSTELGAAAQIGAQLLPERAKTGAAVGALIASGPATHAIAYGSANAIAWGTAAFMPAVLAGAVVVGALAWLFGSDD